jgi:hypothetical protein
MGVNVVRHAPRILRVARSLHVLLSHPIVSRVRHASLDVGLKRNFEDVVVSLEDVLDEASVSRSAVMALILGSLCCALSLLLVSDEMRMASGYKLAGVQPLPVRRVLSKTGEERRNGTLRNWSLRRHANFAARTGLTQMSRTSLRG